VLATVPLVVSEVQARVVEVPAVPARVASSLRHPVTVLLVGTEVLVHVVREVPWCLSPWCWKHSSCL
jgi:hypothetical protein